MFRCYSLWIKNTFEGDSSSAESQWNWIQTTIKSTLVLCDVRVRNTRGPSGEDQWTFCGSYSRMGKNVLAHGTGVDVDDVMITKMHCSLCVCLIERYLSGWGHWQLCITYLSFILDHVMSNFQRIYCIWITMLRSHTRKQRSIGVNYLWIRRCYAYMRTRAYRISLGKSNSCIYLHTFLYHFSSISYAQTDASQIEFKRDCILFLFS